MIVKKDNSIYGFFLQMRPDIWSFFLQSHVNVIEIPLKNEIIVKIYFCVDSISCALMP